MVFKGLPVDKLKKLLSLLFYRDRSCSLLRYHPV